VEEQAGSNVSLHPSRFIVQAPRHDICTGLNTSARRTTDFAWCATSVCEPSIASRLPYLRGRGLGIGVGWMSERSTPNPSLSSRRLPLYALSHFRRGRYDAVVVKPAGVSQGSSGSRVAVVVSTRRQGSGNWATAVVRVPTCAASHIYRCVPLGTHHLASSPRLMPR
jgi:hypothetical protein